MSHDINIITTYKSVRIEFKRAKLKANFKLSNKDRLYLGNIKKLKTVSSVNIERIK